MQSSRSLKIESKVSLLTLFALLERISAEAVKIFIIIYAIYVNVLHFHMTSDQ